jgi:hypothetical protein
MKRQTFESLERDRNNLLKTLAELRAGKFRGMAAKDASQLILDLQKRIDTLSRQMGDDLT